jgi:undecaprenyl-diphosphatase
MTVRPAASGALGLRDQRPIHGELGAVTDARLGGPVDRDRRATFPIRLLAGFVVALTCIVLFGLLADAVQDQELIALDAMASPFVHRIASPGLDALMNGATFLGSTIAITFVVIVAAGWLLIRRRHRAALFLALAIGGSVFLNEALKLFFHRQRPSLPWAHVLPDYSFPSGHTMNSLVCYLGIALLLWVIRGRRLGVISIVIASVLVFAVGVSRIYLGYHYLTDVIGGVLAGLVWLLILVTVFDAGPWPRRAMPA